MVRKSCKRGVHSGNTLRASSSRYTRRYHGDSCIVRRLQTGREQVEDDYLRDHDVLYSLNKKGRWRLPKLLMDNILLGLTVEGSPASTPVSFLQRHKLKRQANCVAVASTSGRHRRRPITGKSGLYFNGLSVLDAGRGRRTRRRRRAKAQASGSSQATQQHQHQQQAEEEEETEEHRQPVAEVRYEAFLPSAASSSISHNPKYIRKPEWTEDGGVFPESRKASKGKARHRRRAVSWRDVALEMEALDFDHELEEEEEEEEGEHNTHDTSSHKGNVQETYGVTATHISLEELIQSAERARDLCERPDQQTACKRQRRQSRSSTGDRPRKVFHVDGAQTSGDGSDETASPSSPSPSPSPAPPSLQDVDSVPVRLILADSDVTPAQLSLGYAGRYLEAACQPRRFILDISEELEARAVSLEGAGRGRGRELDLAAYLVFTYDGFYDAGVSVYGVRLQLQTRLARLRLETVWELSRSSVAAVVEAALAYVSMLGAEALMFKQTETFVSDATDSILTFQHVREARREVMDTFHPEEVVSKGVIQLAFSEDELVNAEVNSSSSTNSDNDASSLESYDLLWDSAEVLPMGASSSASGCPPLSDMAAGADPFPDEEPQFCNICFVEVGAGLSDAPGVTWLRACAHVFCNDCWQRHLSDRITSGAVKLECPEYRCETEVDAGTVLSLLSLSQVRQWRRRQVEQSVRRSPGQTWCPNPRCGRVLRLRGRGAGPGRGPGGEEEEGEGEAVSVACVCGWTTCLACGREAHWPASCQQERRYRDRLTARGDDVLKARDTSKDVKVRGKNCPSCKVFIEKNGGCPCMQCRCGHTFCWQCLKKWSCGSGACYRKKDDDTSKVVRVRSVKRKETESDAYLLALHHRSQRTKSEVKSLKMAADHLGFRLKRAQAGGDEAGLERLQVPGLTAGAAAGGPREDRVAALLSRAVQLKLELHHVVEHAAILQEEGLAGRERRRIRGLLERLSSYSHSLGAVLRSQEKQALQHTLPRLLALQKLAGAGLRALVRALQSAQTSPSE